MSVEEERARFLVGLVRKYVLPEETVLEVGCKGGRNLDSLYNAGFTQLTGLEPSEERVGQIEERYPELWERVSVIYGRPESTATRFRDSEFDLVFSVGYFEGSESDERVLDEMARLSGRCLISIEDERSGRDYRRSFESRGLRQVEQVDISRVPGLESVFLARVFQKSEGGDTEGEGLEQPRDK